MRALLAITKQTLRACVRSKVVILLLVLNVVAAVALPLTVRGDGTATAQLQVSLTYSLRAVTGLISLAALWVGCSNLAREIESYNMHLVLTKPAARWQVWMGKWLGVFTMSAGVLLVSGAVLYGLILVKFRTGDFSEQEKAEARDEILVGRRVYSAYVPDFEAIAQKEYRKRLEAGDWVDEHDPRAVIAELKRQIKLATTGVPPGQRKGWQFSGLRAEDDETRVFVRYRLYVGGKGFDKQRETIGRWLIINPDEKEPGRQVVATPPMKVMSGGFQEFSFPASLMSDRGRVGLVYENFDPQDSAIVFQPDDGPSLLIRTTGFTGNWLRAMLVGLLRLALLSALGCTFGAVFSTPVAIFVAFAYLLLGAIMDPELGAPTRDLAGNVVSWKIKDMLSYSAGSLVRLFVASLRNFDVTHSLARGYLIDGAKIARLALLQVGLRGLPMAILGVWIFSRRELGKVIRR